MANVKFLSVKSFATFKALETKDSLALYWIDETQQLFKGDKLFGTGALATKDAAGLLSPEDYTKLQELIAAGNGISGLSAVDGTIKIADTENGGKAIGVGLSAVEGNMLLVKEDGLYVGNTVVPEYSIEKQEVAEEGFAVSYKLKKTVGEEVSYIGDVINIAKDMMLKSATLEVVTEANVPYTGATVGDPYIKMVFNDASTSNIYIPVKGLIDTYTAGDFIEIVDNKISVKISENSHGLVAVNGALDIALATRKSDGAMSKEDKIVIDSIPYTYTSKKYDISNIPAGTVVDYRDHEIRVMCPADAEFKKQEVGTNGNPNMYYMTFKVYAPSNAVTFKEGDRGALLDEVHDFNGPASGVDEFGRKYSVCWLALASLDDVTGKWNYFGKNSSTSKYIGWDYIAEWYDIDGNRIGLDTVRINLSNEDCHITKTPYYMQGFATVEEVAAIKESVANVEESYIWNEL